MTTDGAANMVGKYNGTTVNFKRLVEKHCRVNNVESLFKHTVWCFVHRLNLVTKSFLTMKHANVVLSFADWFANKRRQVSYKRFLTTNYPDEKVRAIPQPSDTRWMFYRDVVAAILSQVQLVESFVSREHEFIVFWNGLRRDVAKYGPRVMQ